MSFNGSLMARSGGQDSPAVAPRNCVGYYGPFCGESLPRGKHGSRATWQSLDKVGLVSLNRRHIAPMAVSDNATDPRLDIRVQSTDRRTTF